MESGISIVKRNFLFKFVMFVLILMGLSCSRASALKVGDAISDKDCLTFTAIDGDATVKFSWSEANKVMCSVDDGDNWFNYDANKEIYLEKGESVKFKGSGIITGYSYNYLFGFKISGGNLSISGNLNSLRLDDNLERFVGLQNYCFGYMFSDCKNLIDASNLMLDAEILSPYCYEFMFSGCENLIKASELPATCLAEGCYYGMFAECESLANAPGLPATTLKTICYSTMFYKCTSLTKVPDLPATYLAEDCYFNMFSECTNLEFSESMTDRYNKEWTIRTDGLHVDDHGHIYLGSRYESMFCGCIVNWLKYAPENSTVTLYQKEKDNLMGSNGLTGSYNNKSETLSATSEEQEASSPQESSDDMSSSQIDAQSVSSSQLANTQGYESDSEEQENSSLKEPSDDIDPKYDSDTKSVSSNQLANTQGYESESLEDSKNSDSTSSNSLTNNQNSSGSSNAAKSSAIKTGELTANYIFLEFFLLMLLSFKRKKFEF